MKKLSQFLLSVIIVLTLASAGWGQTTFGWNFGTSSGDANANIGVPVDNLTISALSQGNNNGTTTLLTTTSASSGYTGASGTYNAGAAARIGALNTGSSGSAYFEITLTPTPGFTMTISSISFGSRETSTGPKAYTVRSSTDSYASDIATGTMLANSTWALKSNTGLTFNSSSAVTIRIYGYNGTGSPSAGTANWRIDDLSLTVTVASASSPNISVTGTLSAFTTSVGTPSASQTYTVSATNLTANLVITPPTGFQVRENGVGSFGSSLTFIPSSGTVTSKTIEVRFNPGGVGTYSGNVTNASTDATTKNIAVSGIANAIYYNVAGSNVDLLASWGTETDGSGTNPTDFISDNQTFIIQNGSTSTIVGDWTVAGTSSKVILGDGTNSINFTIPSSFSLTGIIDLSANSTITVQNSTLPTWGTINSGSTINFAQTGSFTIPNTFTYGNLVLTGGTKTFSGNNTTISGNLTFDNTIIGAPGASPFSSIYLSGNLTYTGTVTSPADANSITLYCTNNGTQTIKGNGNTVRFFRILTTGTSTNVVLSTTGGSTNCLLGNLSGGGLNLGTGTNLTVNSNTITFLENGKGTFLGTGTLSCDGTSNLVLNSVQTSALGTMYFAPTGNTVNNLTINETNATSNFTLGSSLIINGTLTLTSGSLATGSNTVFFGTSAANPIEAIGKTIIGTAVMNARSVGTGSINFLSANIASGIDNLGNVIINRKTGTAGVITVGSFTSIACNWTITADNQPTNGRDVTYSWLSDFDNGKVFSSTNKGQVWVSDDAITWTTSGLPVDVSGSDPRSLTNNVNHFSYWVVSPEDSPMPVNLSSFNSNITGRNVRLSWVTETELNNAGFQVQRIGVREQGTDWQSLGFVEGKGTKNTPTSYSFEDRNLNTGKYKYRLKQIDHNGNYEYFELNGEVEVGVPKKYDISQNYPNPFNPVTKINFDLPENGRVDIRLYDMLGREVAVLVNEVRNAGYHTEQFDASKLSSGIYFYRMNAGKFSGIKKMAVVK